MTSEKCPGTEVATSFDHLIGTSQAHASEIRNLQQLTVADPGSGKVGLGLAGCGAITAGLVQFRQPVIRPAIGGRPAERALELPLRLGVTAGLQQGGGKRLPDRLIPIGRLGVGQRVLQCRRPFEPDDGGAIVALGLGYACEDHRARDAEHLLRRDA